MFYEDVFKALNGNNVKYLVIGGLAVFLHGVPRSTFDLDIIVSLREDDLTIFNDAMKTLGFKLDQHIDIKSLSDPSVRQNLLSDKHLFAVTYRKPDDPLSEVDVLINHPLDFEESFAKGSIMDIGQGTKITVASIEDMISLKNISGRAQDLSDIASLTKAKDVTNEDKS